MQASETAHIEALWLLNAEGQAALVVPPLATIYGIAQVPNGIAAGADLAALTLPSGHRLPLHYPDDARPTLAAAMLRGRLDLFEIGDDGQVVRETVLHLHS